MATPLPPSCNYQSGSGARLYIQTADCTKAPWSASSAFSPSFAGVDSDSSNFVGNFSGIPDLSAGFDTVQVFTAAGNGWNSTIKGAGSGNGSFNVVMDKDSPLADQILSGEMYDFVITYGFTEPTGSTAADQVIGRFRAGKPSLPVQLSGEAIMISIPFMTSGPVYGDVLGLASAPST